MVICKYVHYCTISKILKLESSQVAIKNGMDGLYYSHTIEYYLAMRMKGPQSNAKIQMNLTNVTLKEARHKRMHAD